MNTIKRYWVIGLLGYWAIGLIGCVSIREAAKGIAGISTKELKDSRKSAITKTFGFSHNDCYKKTEGALKIMNSYIYAKDAGKTMIAIYVSEQDTTPVGIFFTDIDAGNTRIEVSSPSTYAKELISAKLFSGLEEKIIAPVPAEHSQAEH